jgi:EmrB/QacA subfamily drug resistance transporter
VSATDSSQRRGIALAVISAAQLMVVLDTSIVFVALPSIERGLHFSADNLVWVSTAYALTFGGLLLFGGRTGDLFGRRRMFMTGIAIFTVASLIGGFAQSDVWLIVTRAAQGVGAAIASPTALSLIATNFAEGRERTRAMGVYAAMSGTGAAIGLLAGGLLTELVSWRWVLFVNVPIGAAVLLLAPRVLRESETRPGQLDVPGAVTVTAGMASFVYGLTNAASHSWGSPTTIGFLLAAVVLLGTFVVIETQSRRPLMPLRIFKNRNRSGAYAMMLCYGTAMFGMFFFMTQYLQDVLHFSAIQAGLGFLPMSVAIVVMSQVSARIVSRIGIRLPLLISPILTTGGMLLLTQLSPSSGYLGAIVPLVVVATGMGFGFVPLTLTAVSGVRPEESGLASALLNTGQQVGGAIGLALLSTVAIDAIRSRTTQVAAAHHGHLTAPLIQAATLHGYHRAFLLAAAADSLALIISVTAIRAPRQPVVEPATAGAVPATAPATS